MQRVNAKKDIPFEFSNITTSVGYALWDFRGDFGILDSGRSDVEYENWHGYKLDRKLLELLRKY